MTDHFDLFVRYSTALYWQHTHNIMYGVDMSTLDELNINMPLSLVNHGLKFHFGARTRSYRSVGVVAIKSNQIKWTCIMWTCSLIQPSMPRTRFAIKP